MGTGPIFVRKKTFYNMGAGLVIGKRYIPISRPYSLL